MSNETEVSIMRSLDGVGYELWFRTFYGELEYKDHGPHFADSRDDAIIMAMSEWPSWDLSPNPGPVDMTDLRVRGIAVLAGLARLREVSGE